jgi:hypothetical protein
VHQFENPIILILVFATVFAFFLGDLVDAVIILALSWRSDTCKPSA